jgi:predicted transcriptional regulator
MTTVSIPIGEDARRLLRELAERTGRPETDLIDEALTEYHRRVFLHQLNAGYGELRADGPAWAEHEAERREWDVTLMDGLDPGERWTEDGRCLTSEE